MILDQAVNSAFRKNGNNLTDEGKRLMWIRELMDMGVGKHDWGFSEFDKVTTCRRGLPVRKSAHYVPYVTSCPNPFKPRSFSV